jgi:SAM-dependent methyltransferase
MRESEQWASHSLKDFYNAESLAYLQKRPWMQSYIPVDLVEITSCFLKSNLKWHDGQIRVLNVGCGPGWLEDSLISLGDSSLQDTLFVSVDIAVNMVKIAKKQNPHIQTIVADGNTLPFRSSSFDVVITSRAIKFLRPTSFLSCVKRVLRRDGLALVIFDCGDALWVKLLESGHFPIDVGVNSRTLRSKELLSLLNKMGFCFLASFRITNLPLSLFSYIPQSLHGFLKHLDKPQVFGARINVICVRGARV